MIQDSLLAKVHFMALRYPKDVPAAVVAAQFGLIEIFTYFLRQPHALEAAGSDCITPLLGAARNGHVEKVGNLLAAGANVNEVTELGLTALMYAADIGHVSMIDFSLTMELNWERKTNTTALL